MFLMSLFRLVVSVLHEFGRERSNLEREVFELINSRTK